MRDLTVSLLQAELAWEDPNGHHYSGDSLAFDARGECIADLGGDAASATVSFDGQALLDYREHFPFQVDADDFRL